MNLLQTVLAFVVVICLLVIVHELGHYLVARWCGVKVLRFSVGMGKVIWSRRFGADQTEVEDDSLWAINPFSFTHGYIAWGDGEVLGEKMAPVTQPLPELEPAPPGAKKGWEPQTGLSLKCIKGEDRDTEARFQTTSVGGRRAVADLAQAIATQVEKDQSKPVPVVRLKKSHYLHKSYGRIYTPVFDVVEWVSLDGPDAEVKEEAAAEEPAPEAGRRRRRTA